jgi:hypothetical protein
MISNFDDLNEAERCISVAREAIENADIAIRSEFFSVKEALLNLSSALMAIRRNVEADRKERADTA